MYTVYDRIFCDVPAKNTVYKPCIYGSGQPYICMTCALQQMRNYKCNAWCWAPAHLCTHTHTHTHIHTHVATSSKSSSMFGLFWIRLKTWKRWNTAGAVLQTAQELRACELHRVKIDTMLMCDCRAVFSCKKCYVTECIQKYCVVFCRIMLALEVARSEQIKWSNVSVA